MRRISSVVASFWKEEESDKNREFFLGRDGIWLIPSGSGEQGCISWGGEVCVQSIGALNQELRINTPLDAPLKLC